MTDARKKLLRERHESQTCRCYAELPKWKKCKYELMSGRYGTFKTSAAEAEKKRLARLAAREVQHG